MCAVMRVLILFAAMAVLSGCHSAETEAARKVAAEHWRDTPVVKICRDGTYIYRLRNGEHWTGGISRRVENPETVCG